MPKSFLLIFFSLAATAQRRDQMVVTGVWDPIPLEEADRSVRVLNVTGLRLVANTFADLLKLDSSLDLRQRAPNTIQGDLSIRGGTFGQTLVLLDGLRVNDAQSGHHHLNLPVALDSLASIEVLKGSGSAHYGSDAVGGVVHFRTRRPEASELRLRGGLGNFGVNQQSVGLDWARGRVNQQVNVSRDFSTGFIPNRDYRNLSAAALTHVSTALGWTNVTLGHADRPFGAERFYGNFNSWERTKTWFAGLRQDLGKRTNASFGYRRHTDLFVLYRDRPQVFTNRHASESWQAAVRRREDWRNGALQAHYGVEGYGDRIASNNLGQHSRARGAAYAALDARALRRFSFSAAVRDEVYGRFRHQVSPSLAAGAWLGPSLKVRGGVSRAFRVPTFTDLYYQDPANRGSPDLRPETAWSYEGGLDWNWRGELRAQVTVFQRRERDGIDYVRASATDIWRAANIHRLRFTGVEAGVDWKGLDFQYTGLKGAQTALAGVQSKYVFNYPVHSGLAGWRRVWPRGVVTRLRIGALERLGRDPYAVADFYAARASGNFRPFVQLTNFNGAVYEEIPGVAMPGRAIVAGIEYRVPLGR